MTILSIFVCLLNVLSCGSDNEETEVAVIDVSPAPAFSHSRRSRHQRHNKLGTGVDRFQRRRLQRLDQLQDN